MEKSDLKAVKVNGLRWESFILALTVASVRAGHLRYFFIFH